MADMQLLASDLKILALNYDAMVLDMDQLLTEKLTDELRARVSRNRADWLDRAREARDLHAQALISAERQADSLHSTIDEEVERCTTE